MYLLTTIQLCVRPIDLGQVLYPQRESSARRYVNQRWLNYLLHVNWMSVYKELPTLRQLPRVPIARRLIVSADDNDLCSSQRTFRSLLLLGNA
jgi:hypothetical protein